MAAWRGLLPLLLRDIPEFPTDDDGGGGGSGGEANGAPPSREVQWEAVDAEIDEGEFFRFRRLCATEVWQSAALALGPVAVLAEQPPPSAAPPPRRGGRSKSVPLRTRRHRARPPPARRRGGRGEPPPPPSPTAAASELDTVLGRVLAASAALPADAHSQLLRASLKLGGAFAAWLGKGAGTAARVDDAVCAPITPRPAAFSRPGGIHRAVVALLRWRLRRRPPPPRAVAPPARPRGAARARMLGRAAEALVHALVRLLVRLPACRPRRAPRHPLRRHRRTARLRPRRRRRLRRLAAAHAAAQAAHRPGGAAPAADVESVAAGAARRLRAAIKFLDAAPPLPDGSHAVVCVLGEC